MAVSYNTLSEEDLSQLFTGNSTPEPAPAVEKDPMVDALTVTPEKEEETPEPLDDILFETEDSEKPAATAEKSTGTKKESVREEEETPEEQTEEEYTKQLFKHTAKKLIEKGVFADVEDFEDLEMDEDTFQEFVEAQVQHRTEEQWERIKGSNEVVNGILSAIEAGVDADKILDLFKEQKAITAIDTSTPAGKLDYIEQYYRMLEWDDRKISRELKRIDASGDDALQEEFEFAQEKTLKFYQEEQQRLIEQKKQQEAQEATRIRNRAQGAYKALQEAGVKDQKAQQLISNSFKKYQLPSGDILDGFEVALLQVKNDPARYAEVVRFLFDKENYIKEIQTKTQNTVVDKTFQGLKFKPPGKASTNTTPPPTSKSSNSKDTTKDFVQALLGNK